MHPPFIMTVAKHLRQDFATSLTWQEETGQRPPDNAMAARFLSTDFGPMAFMGYADEAAEMENLFKELATSPHARTLVRKTDLAQTIFYVPYELDFWENPSPNPRYFPYFNLIAIPQKSRIKQESLAHEIAHRQQHTLGLNDTWEGINLCDMFLEEGIAEGAAAIHGLMTAWDISYHKCGLWLASHLPYLLLALNLDVHMAPGDRPDTRERAMAAGFKAFFCDIHSEHYEQKIVARLQNMEAETLRTHLLAPKRPRKDYDRIMEQHGFKNLRYHLPDLDWDNPFWCGVLASNRKALETIVQEKCPDLAGKKDLLPPISHHVPRRILYKPLQYALRPFLKAQP